MRGVALGICMAALAFGVGGGTAAANPNLVANGDFESSYNGGASSEFGSAGYANITGWTVSGVANSTPYDVWWNASNATTVGAASQYSGFSNQVLSTVPASDGSAHFVGLDGDSGAVGVLAQAVSGLTVGHQYQLSFLFAAAQMPTGANVAYSIGLAFNLGATALNSATGAPNTGTYNEAARTGTNWISETYTFTATTTNEILSFLAFGGPTGDPPIALLDNVSLVDVPEPSSLALMAGAAALCAAFMVRRTRSSRV